MSDSDASAERFDGDGHPCPGQVVVDRYRIGELLGQGGMGAVFAAHDLERDEPVALKIILPGEAENRDSAKRFTREARAVRAIRSVHVAQVLDVGELENGIPFMVLELLVGEPFDQIIRERAPLPVEQAVDYVLQACEGIAQAHARGVIHRDLKPSNLFLTESPKGEPLVKVLDFGIAKATSPLDPDTDAISLTDSSSTLGSPQYMSPEQLRCSKSVGVGTDIWSLGLILFKLLTGKPAFEADSVGAHFTMIVAEPPTRLRELQPDASVALETIIFCCLEKREEDRYQDVGQLAEALEEEAPAGAAARVARIRTILDSAGASSPSFPGLSSSSSAAELVATMPRAERLAEQLGDRLSKDDTMGTTRAWDASLGSAPGPRGKSSWMMAALAVLAAVGLGVGAYGWLQKGEGTFGTEPAAPSAAAPTSAPSASPAGESSATAATSVRIRLTLDPPDAQVRLDGTPTRENPILLPRGEGTHEIVVSAPGRVSSTHEVRATEDRHLRIDLPPAGSALAPAGPEPPPVGTTQPTVSAPPPPPSVPAVKPKGPMADSL
ncbi:MAG: serine/threonine protein kinase [Deltaproteobacteria bacterium]|nr:serine/threonine protein kinase [Deltaproteobacteria bacterium]